MTKKPSTKIKVGISIGDINGIGMEVILKTLEDNRICELCSPIIYGSKDICNYYIKSLQINNINLNYIASPEKIKGKQMVDVMNAK